MTILTLAHYTPLLIVIVLYSLNSEGLTRNSRYYREVKASKDFWYYPAPLSEFLFHPGKHLLVFSIITDLFGNPLSEESGYRLHVIRACGPGLQLLDQHIVTVEERDAAMRLPVIILIPTSARFYLCGEFIVCLFVRLLF